MPYYDLYCEKCHYVEENFFHSIHEDHPMCPDCKDVRLSSVIHSSAVQGITSPGNPQFNSHGRGLPSDIKKWLNIRKDQNREVEKKLEKPIEWPGGEVK